MRVFMIRPVSLLAALVVATTCLPASLRAQVLEPPARPFGALFGASRLPDPNLDWQQLTLAMNLLGGYGDSLQPYGVSAGQDVQAGYTGFGDAALTYERVRQRSRFDLEGRGYGTTFSDPSAGPLWGAEVRAQANAAWGRRSRFDFAQRIALDPFVVLGAFGPLRSDMDLAEIPQANPTDGLSANRSWMSDSLASLEYRWNPRATVTGGYSYNRRGFPSGGGVGTREQTAFVRYDRSLGRVSGLGGEYRYQIALTLPDAADSVSHVQNSAALGFRAGKRLSPSREISMGLAGGATHSASTDTVTGLRSEDWLPSWSANFSATVGRTWSARADYRRAVTVLQGAAGRAFWSDAVVGSTGGLLGQRVDVAFAGGYSTGSRGVGEADTGDYLTYSISGHVRVALKRWCASVVTYSYYKHEFDDVAGLPTLFPTRLEHNTIRIGLSFWVPLHGSPLPREGRRPGQGS